MEEKYTYYTPDQSEFHYGFEFQLKSINQGWQTEVFGDSNPKSFYSIPQLVHALNGYNWSEHIRVRHLCHEDIVGLGWEEIAEQFTNDIGCKAYAYRQFSMRTNNMWAVYAIRNGNLTVYCGTIRNRSELQRIMKMVGIEK